MQDLSLLHFVIVCGIVVVGVCSEWRVHRFHTHGGDDDGVCSCHSAVTGACWEPRAFGTFGWMGIKMLVSDNMRNSERVSIRPGGNNNNNRKKELASQPPGRPPIRAPDSEPHTTHVSPTGHVSVLPLLRVFRRRRRLLLLLYTNHTHLAQRVQRTTRRGHGNVCLISMGFSIRPHSWGLLSFLSV